jgi:uncharacterized membrane protein
LSEERREVASVADVREELRRLGYLESGLDRFVLGAATPASAWRASLSAAVRVGVAGGVILGVALTLAAAGLDAGRLSRPSDLALLALYLSIALGLATGLIALVGGLTAAWAARRLGRRPGGALSRNVGVVLSLAGLAYLVLWWRSHAASAPLAAQPVFVLIGLALAAVLGRFGTLAAVAVLSAARGREGIPDAPLSGKRLLPLLAVAMLLFGGGVALSTLVMAERPAPPDFAVVPTGLRVRVVAVDGLERRMALQMLSRGEMPALASLLSQAAVGELRAEPEQVPAIVWTTIATGRGPEAHGIRAPAARRLPGMVAPVPLGAEEGAFGSALARAADLLRITRAEPPSALLRSIKTFWNVAGEKGLSVGVVNWWASWPAEPVTGYVVSDRAFFKLERGGAPDREVYPPQAFERLRSLLPPRDEDAARRLDKFHAAAALLLRGSAPPDLQAVYLNGLDVFSVQRLGEGPEDLAALDERLEQVRAYHRFLDGLLGELVAERGPEDVVLLIADPGRLARRADAHPLGLLALAGGPVAKGEIGLVSERDVAPTVLDLLGLPVSRELHGRVLEKALDPAFLASHPVRFVASYGRRPASRAAGSAFDPAVMEELKSLGYVH